ncbi:AMP-binding enzyme, partial [Streptomyces sp. 4F14]|uniref:AMP-binding enzyme n=1 Tax=Streptomyces sp. 4F14 TaxID=3394380 RepID=UPI003A8C68B2
FVVLKAGTERDPGEVEAELVRLVRERIGAVASLKEVAVVAALPKTRSGKILRKTMRGIADGHDEPIPSTVDDPSVIETLRPLLHRPDHTV